MELRVRGPKDLIYKYKIFCMKNKISVPDKTMELIKKFLEINEENNAYTEKEK
jgi:hypothetical protein